MSECRNELERKLGEAAATIRRGEAPQNAGIADARDRLREAAQNEATAIELSRQNKELHARVAELTEACNLRTDELHRIAGLLGVEPNADAINTALAKREAVAVPDEWVCAINVAIACIDASELPINWSIDRLKSVRAAMLAAAQQHGGEP